MKLTHNHLSGNYVYYNASCPNLYKFDDYGQIWLVMVGMEFGGTFLLRMYCNYVTVHTYYMTLARFVLTSNAAMPVMYTCSDCMIL